MGERGRFKLENAFNRFDEIIAQVDDSEPREGNMHEFLDDLGVSLMPFIVNDVHSLSSSTFHSLDALMASLS